MFFSHNKSWVDFDNIGEVIFDVWLFKFLPKDRSISGERASASGSRHASLHYEPQVGNYSNSNRVSLEPTFTVFQLLSTPLAYNFPPV